MRTSLNEYLFITSLSFASVRAPWRVCGFLAKGERYLRTRAVSRHSG